MVVYSEYLILHPNIFQTFLIPDYIIKPRLSIIQNIFNHLNLWLFLLFFKKALNKILFFYLL